MESGKEGKSEAIDNGNKAHSRYIVAVHASLFSDTIIYFQERGLRVRGPQRVQNVRLVCHIDIHRKDHLQPWMIQ